MTSSSTRLHSAQVARRAFTLIEMLIVLAVVAILSSFVLSITQEARERSYRTVCTSNLRQLVTAAKMYEADNEHLPIQWGALPPHGPQGHWQEQIFPYVKSRQIYLCPADASGGTETSTEGGWPYSYRYFLSEFWLNPDLSYRPPSARSFLFIDQFHAAYPSAPGELGKLKNNPVFMLARYDGSIEAARLERYKVMGYEPADGLPMLR